MRTGSGIDAYVSVVRGAPGALPVWVAAVYRRRVVAGLGLFGLLPDGNRPAGAGAGMMRLLCSSVWLGGAGFQTEGGAVFGGWFVVAGVDVPMLRGGADDYPPADTRPADSGALMGEAMTADQFLAAKQEWRNRARATSQQVRKRRPVVHRVYELLFPDGKIYVGVTKLTWHQREYHHRRSLSVVGRRLEMFPDEPPRLEYLHEVECDCGQGLQGLWMSGGGGRFGAGAYLGFTGGGAVECGFL